MVGIGVLVLAVCAVLGFTVQNTALCVVLGVIGAVLIVVGEVLRGVSNAKRDRRTNVRKV